MRKLKLKRKIGAIRGEVEKPTATQTVEQSGARQIRDLPTEQYELVIEALRENAPLDAIVGFFSDQGWLTVTDKTFKQYLGAFRRVYPDLIRGENETNLDSIVSKKKVAFDEEAYLEQLARVQSRRLKLGVEFEINTGIVNQHLHKDMAEARELATTLAKMRGKGMQVGRPGANQASTASSTEAKEQLRSLDQGAAAQDKLTTLFGQLAPLLKARQEHG